MGPKLAEIEPIEYGRLEARDRFGSGRITERPLWGEDRDKGHCGGWKGKNLERGGNVSFFVFPCQNVS